MKDSHKTDKTNMCQYIVVILWHSILKHSAKSNSLLSSKKIFRLHINFLGLQCYTLTFAIYE